MSKIIHLPKGKISIIDDDCFEYVNRHKWYAAWNGRKWYVVRHARKSEQYPTAIVYLHRFIMGVTDRHVYIDHINGDGLDCRRDNMRLCTNYQNLFNRGKQKSNKLGGFKGVTFDKARGKFMARITRNGETFNLGRFNTAIEAALVYDNAALIYHGEFAHLNFRETS